MLKSLAVFAVLVLAVALAPASPQSRVAPVPIPAKPYVTLMGHDSAIASPRFVRVTDRESWDALWRDHRGDDVPKNASGWPNLPVVDFETCQVIAVFSGAAWNCNGEYVQSMVDRGKDWLIRFDSATFQTAGSDGGGIRVRPYGMWVIPRGNKPITLEENVQGLIGRPAKWKQQHRFDAIPE